MDTFSSNAAIEIFSEHSGIFNGLGMRVSANMVAQIAALPEVYAIYPNWAMDDSQPESDEFPIAFSESVAIASSEPPPLLYAKRGRTHDLGRNYLL